MTSSLNTAAKRAGVTLLSRFFRPTVNRPRDTTAHQEMISRSQRLMLDLGVVERASATAAFHILPTGYRALTKLVNLIEDEMTGVGAQRLAFSTFCSKSLLDQSKRFEMLKDVLYTLQDRRGVTLCLAPTHEEPATSLFSDRLPYGEDTFPLLIYQITNKYRDEPAPKYGLLRSNEFLMKDLYSFHVDEECAARVYEVISAAYLRIFEKLDLDAYRVRADSGAMGGQCSHEFHLVNDCGQDEIFFCSSCGTGVNKELAADSKDVLYNGENLIHSACGKAMTRLRTIEAAHTFILGTKYSEALGAFWTTGRANAKASHLHMACYGIGVSRLLAAAVDCHLPKELNEENVLRWPKRIAPFLVCVIPPKRGSKEDIVSALAWDVASGLASRVVTDHSDVLFDDRTDETVGRRVKSARSLGCPYIIVVNKTAMDHTFPKFELINVYENTTDVVSHAELFELIRNGLVAKGRPFCSSAHQSESTVISNDADSVTLQRKSYAV